MRGTIIKRSKDSYRIKAPKGKNSETGKYEYHYETVRGNKKEAERRLNQVINDIEKGIFVKPSKMVFREYLESWLLDYCEPVLSVRTYQLYDYTCHNHIIPELGEIPLNDLKPQHLQKLYAKKLKSGLSNRTVQLIHVTVNKALKNAVKTELLVRNVAEIVDTPKSKRPEIKIMSESDIHLLLDYAKDTPYYALFYTALFTGMRRAELLALRWSDVDLDMCQVSVNRSMQFIDRGKSSRSISFKEPKTAKSRRLIALSPSTAIVLVEYRDSQNYVRLSLDFPKLSDDDLVFCHHDGSPFLPDTITHAWIKLTRKCGLIGIRLHDARHTHASLMLKQGVHPKIVQERLGHSSITLTLDTYPHIVPGMQKAAAEKFDNIINKDVDLVHSLHNNYTSD